MSSSTERQGAMSYVAPPVSAMGAIVPVFWGLMTKSAQQKGLPTPYMKVREAIGHGVRATPAFGIFAGTQLVAQEVIEGWLVKKRGVKDMTTMALAAVAVGVISVPPAVIFNGMTQNMGPMESFKGLNAAQVIAITSRETSFLASIRVSKPLSEELEKVLGKGPATTILSGFLSGGIGSFFGHPFDTWLTRSQAKLPTTARDLMRGAPVKAVSLGIFTVLYSAANDVLKKL